MEAQYTMTHGVSLKMGNQNQPKIMRNIARGHYYEDVALSYFQIKAKCKVEKSGFFHHPQNSMYGSSPDALGPVLYFF